MSDLKLFVDYRESKCIELLSNYEIEYENVNLTLGDFALRNNVGEDIIIIERKSLSDLASSIQDGRYTEQSFRLDASTTHNHNIIYVIEGNLERMKFHSKRMNKNTVLSAMNSILLFKGFSVYRTQSTIETVQFIMNLLAKVNKELNKGKSLFYSGINLEDNCVIEDNQTNTIQNKNTSNIEIVNNEVTILKQPTKNNQYLECVKTSSVKKDNITKDNIQLLMLSQIPHVSINIAKCLIAHYGTLENMLNALKCEKEGFGKNILYTTTTGKVRKIPSNVIAKIKCLFIEN
jgi:ERCC4-type nuclease